MKRIVKVAENWSRRDRRTMGRDIVLPGKGSPGMNELIIIADSSGSVYLKSVFERIATAVNYIVRVVKPLNVRVVWADDTDCAGEDFFEPGDTIVLNPKGGGGTDMCKPLRFVERYSPEVVLLITDGYTPWPSNTPYPLIIACVTDTELPEWAAQVRITVGG